MKITDLKIGDKIKHYATGVIVTGEVIEVTNTGTRYQVKTKHEPQMWHGGKHDTTLIYEQDKHLIKHGYSQTVPKCFDLSGAEITA
jgi:hypothetical protein